MACRRVKIFQLTHRSKLFASGIRIVLTLSAKWSCAAVLLLYAAAKQRGTRGFIMVTFLESGHRRMNGRTAADVMAEAAAASAADAGPNLDRKQICTPCSQHTHSLAGRSDAAVSAAGGRE